MCIGEVGRAVDGEPALIELLTVFEDVFGDFSEIDIEIASSSRFPTLFLVDERVEHPKLYILDIGSLEVVGVKAPHHAAPVLCGVVEGSVVVEIGIEVVRTTLVRVVGDVHTRQCRRGSRVATLIAVRVELPDVDLAHVRIGEHVQVALYMRRRQ